MKSVCAALILFSSLSSFAQDGKVGGMIQCPQCPQATPLEGKLTIVAKDQKGEIVARTVLNKPNFPQLFILTSKQSVPLGKPLPTEMIFQVQLDYAGKVIEGKQEPRAKLGDRTVEISF